MKTAIKSRWDGGVSDPRDIITNGCASTRHFILGKTKLTPYRDMVTETLDTGTLANQRLTDVIRYTYSGTTTQIFGLGQVSTSNPYPKFYQKSTVNTPTASFQAISSGEDTSGTVIPGSLIGYKGALYCLKTKSGTISAVTGNCTYLVKMKIGTGVTEIGIIGFSPSNGVVPQMFIHPTDNRLYMASGYTVGVYTGDAATGSSSDLSTRDFSTAHDITSICPKGNDIMLGMASRDTTGSVVGVWNGSTTSSVLTDIVNWGNDTLMVLENIGDIVVGISGLSVGGSSDVGTQNTVTIRAYSGGTAQIIQRLESINGTGSNNQLGSRVYPLKARRNDSIYFPMSVNLNGTRVHQIWTIYKNEAGQLVVAPDRKCNNDTELTSESIIGLSIIGDYMWVAFSATSTTGSFMRTDDQEVFSSTSSYETLVNPGMDVSDRSAKKGLKAISLRCGSPSGASHTVTISYSVDGSAFRTIYTGASSEKVRVIEEVAETEGTKFLEGREYVFKISTTGNGELYEFKYGYEVLKTNI